MTPAEIIEAARNRYNSIGDDFFSDEELYVIIYGICCEINSDGLLIEGKYTTTTVASQQEYDFPTNAINIRRLTYDGKKLHQLTMEEADARYTNTSGTYGTGTPIHYSIWNRVISLYPVPDTALTLAIYTHDNQQTVSNTATISLPAIFHPVIVEGVVAEMAFKDKNFGVADRFRNKFETLKTLRTREFRRSRRGDEPAMVKNIDVNGYTERNW